MRFITGPRQCGKTTIAKAQLEAAGTPRLYYLWDLREVRNRYKASELFFTQDSPPSSSRSQWVCFDEIHKMPKWKNILKAIYDSVSDHYQLMVTGSAKLSIFRRAGDSLSGRYFTFQLFPLSLQELAAVSPELIPPPANAREWILKKMDSQPRGADALSDLLEYGGFPDPFVKQSKVFYEKWARDYMDTIIKEDIGALTRILDKEHLHDLYHLLPEMVGSPISESSLASHLEIGGPTVKNHLKRLEDFYLAFKVHPYSRNIKRALLKAPKCYLYDWRRVQDPGKRFENYVAVELFSRMSLWTDLSGDVFSLFYVRTREKEETDFLIVRNKNPWMLLEIKFSDGAISGHHYKIQKQLEGIPIVQICREEGVCRMDHKDAYRISASRFLA